MRRRRGARRGTRGRAPGPGAPRPWAGGPGTRSIGGRPPRNGSPLGRTYPSDVQKPPRIFAEHLLLHLSRRLVGTKGVEPLREANERIVGAEQGAVLQRTEH